MSRNEPEFHDWFSSLLPFGLSPSSFLLLFLLLPLLFLLLLLLLLLLTGRRSTGLRARTIVRLRTAPPIRARTLVWLRPAAAAVLAAREAAPLRVAAFSRSSSRRLRCSFCSVSLYNKRGARKVERAR